MTPSNPPARQADHPVDPLFLERWSPRSLLAEPIPDDDLMTMFEAARWSPSCFNEQPWLIVFGRSTEDRARLVGLLTPGNQVWARHAAVLAVICARNTFARNAKPNRWAAFDAGAAWMSLALQATRLGYATHAMAGFDVDAVHDVLGVPRGEFTPMAGLAIGRRGPSEALPEDLRERERPSGRKPITDWLMEGTFRA